MTGDRCRTRTRGTITRPQEKRRFGHCDNVDGPEIVTFKLNLLLPGRHAVVHCVSSPASAVRVPENTAPSGTRAWAGGAAGVRGHPRRRLSQPRPPPTVTVTTGSGVQRGGPQCQSLGLPASVTCPEMRHKAKESVSPTRGPLSHTGRREQLWMSLGRILRTATTTYAAESS